MTILNVGTDMRHQRGHCTHIICPVPVVLVSELFSSVRPLPLRLREHAVCLGAPRGLMKLKQLQKVIVEFSPLSGKSRSAREFVSRLQSPKAQASNPECTLSTRVRTSGAFPCAPSSAKKSSACIET